MAKEYKYTVSGTWPFPVDMLRYDQSRPATEQDQASIDRLSTEYAPDMKSMRVPTLITLVTPRDPHGQRWISFGWQVVSADHPLWLGCE